MMTFDILLQEDSLLNLVTPVSEAYKAALENSAKVSITDQYGVILYVNAKFCEICKYEPEELIGKTHQILNSGYQPPSFFEKMWATIQAGQVWNGEICNKTKEGDLYWVDTVIVPFKDQINGENRFLSLRFDITERKRAEERLRVSQALLRVRNEELERVQLQRDEVIEFVVHELKNPLNNLDLLAEVLEEALCSSPELQNVTKQARDITQNMIRIVQNFLDAKKPDLRLTNPSFDAFNLYRLTEMIVRQYDIKAQKKNIQIQLHGQDVPVTVYADMELTMHVLENLISNALKYTPSGKSINIRFEQKSDDMIRCIVEDEGMGIKKEEKDLLFTRYGILSNRALDKEHSTGLGLYLSRKIIENMHGKMWCESESGKGALFVIELPVGMAKAIA